MSGDNWLCPHLIDTRYSRCAYCTGPRIVHGEVTGRQVAEGGIIFPESTDWAQARDVIWDAASFVNRQLSDRPLPPPKMARPYSAAEWKGMAALAAEDRGRDLGTWIEARYNQACICGDRWEPGDLIRFDRDAEAWVCERCGSA